MRKPGFTLMSVTEKESVQNCMKVIYYIFLIREALDLPAITIMKKFVKSRP